MVAHSLRRTSLVALVLLAAACGPEAAPPAHLAQMAAYAAALAAIFPDRTIEAALLYTAGPHLLTIPRALLDSHAPALA